MKRFFCIALCVVLLAGCAVGEKPDAAGITFTDDLGRTVTADRPQRVAALLGSYADVWLLAGGSLCAAPEDAFTDFALPLGEETADLGQTKRLNLEALLASRPDLVLASTNTAQHLELMTALESAGIPVAYFDVSDFSDYLRLLKLCTELTGCPENYDRYGTQVASRVDAVLGRCQGKPGPSVLVLRASATSIRAKNSSVAVLGGMLKDLGCTNIADSDSSLLENLSLESILLQNPDHIFFVQSGDDTQGTRENIEAMFRENPLWGQLDAVKNGRVHHMDKRLFNLKPNARWGEAYEILEDILYGTNEEA